MPDSTAPAVTGRKVLLVAERWYEGDPARGESQAIRGVIDSLDAARYLTGEEPGDTPDRTPCAALRGG